MISFSLVFVNILISLVWMLVRAIVCIKNKKISWKRELQLLLVYVCIMVVARCTFFPFRKIDGQVQPLLFDSVNVLPFRINLVPFVHLFDYAIKSDAWLNLIGNTTMFIPIGVIFPIVYKKLDTPLKAMGAGFAFSLCVEILQLPFFDRVTDIDDLIMNTSGYAVGYLIYALVRRCGKRGEII